MRTIPTAIVGLLGIALLAMLALAGPAHAQGTTTVTGTVTYRDRSLLPQNALVRMQIADTASGQVIAEQQITTNGAQVPIAFAIPYDAARVNASGLYTVQGNISVNGTVRYTTTSQYLVITGDRPTTGIQVLMSVRTTTLPDTSVGGGPLGLAGLLVLLALGAGWARYRVARGD
ncbi:MAG: hypothetical protein RLZZ387_1317 [Chloroflexota bacterium]|jgi:putative lipoprotein